MHLGVNFKKEIKQGLFCFMNILQPSLTAESPTAELGKDLCRNQFHYFSALAQYITEHQNRCVLLKASPDLYKQPFINNADFAKWKYSVLSNDFDGLGVDKSFINIERNSEAQHLFFSIDSLLSLEELPEATFGNNVSQVSFFGLTGNRIIDLGNFLKSDAQPDLSEFLLNKGLFINIVISKTFGYYHSLLIKSVVDVEDKINAFQYVIAPDN